MRWSGFFALVLVFIHVACSDDEAAIRSPWSTTDGGADASRAGSTGGTPNGASGRGNTAGGNTAGTRSSGGTGSGRHPALGDASVETGNGGPAEQDASVTDARSEASASGNTDAGKVEGGIIPAACVAVQGTGAS